MFPRSSRASGRAAIPGGDRLNRASAGVSPRTPPRGAASWISAKGSGPWNRFILVGEWERANTDVDTSRSALSHSPTNGQIAKVLDLCWRSRRQSLLVGSKDEALALARFSQ